MDWRGAPCVSPFTFIPVMIGLLAIYNVQYLCMFRKHLALRHLQSTFPPHDHSPVHRHLLKPFILQHPSRRRCCDHRGAASLAEVCHVGAHHQDTDRVHRWLVIAVTLTDLRHRHDVAVIAFQWLLIVAEAVVEWTCRNDGPQSAVDSTEASTDSVKL